MYQLYEIENLSYDCPNLIYLGAFNSLDEAKKIAEKRQKDWRFQGQERHYKISYFGAECYNTMK